MELYNNRIPINEIKIIRRLKFLSNLILEIPEPDEGKVFYCLFDNISKNEYSKLWIIKIFTDKFNKSDLIFDKIRRINMEIFPRH